MLIPGAIALLRLHCKLALQEPPNKLASKIIRIITVRALNDNMAYEAGSSTNAHTLLIYHQNHMDKTTRTTGPQGGENHQPQHRYHRVNL